MLFTEEKISIITRNVDPSNICFLLNCLPQDNQQPPPRQPTTSPKTTNNLPQDNQQPPPRQPTTSPHILQDREVYVVFGAVEGAVIFSFITRNHKSYHKPILLIKFLHCVFQCSSM